MSDESLALLHQVIDAHSVHTLDLTGGAPEMHPRFRELVSHARREGLRVIDHMVLLMFIRGCEQTLRDCPQSYRQAVAGLAISRVGYLRRILLPFAARGIAAALVHSAGRALAETAMLLFTAGYVMRWPESLFDSGRTLAVHIYDLAMNVSSGSPASAATALVLLGFALVIQLRRHAGISPGGLRGAPTMAVSDRSEVGAANPPCSDPTFHV